MICKKKKKSQDTISIFNAAVFITFEILLITLFPVLIDLMASKSGNLCQHNIAKAKDAQRQYAISPLVHCCSIWDPAEHWVSAVASSNT